MCSNAYKTNDNLFHYFRIQSRDWVEGEREI